MKYPRLSVLLLGLLSLNALAESGAYRVEIVVFRNLGTAAAADEADELRSFSKYPALEDSELPDDFSVVTKMGRTMDRAWRRLRSSGSYQPLLYAAWEQERIEYYPAIHIHSDRVIGSRLRSPAPLAAPPPAAKRSGAAGPVAVEAEPQEFPAAGPDEPAVAHGDAAGDRPQPVYDKLYQLDGTVQLRRSRFLHLDLDLEYRLDAGELPDPETGQNINGATRVYRFRQSRQVNTGEMQYFDSPYFGALVLVTAVQAR